MKKTNRIIPEKKKEICVIFDMDGVIIDSEPFWQEAEVDTFRAIGVPLTVEMCQQTTGLRVDAVVEYWYHRFPWSAKPHDEIGHEIKKKVHDLIIKNGTAKPGAVELINELSKLKIPLGICSSSALFIIEAVCHVLKIREHFQVLQTAEDCQYGKPHPEPYLMTANRLNFQPNQCIVIEDSLNGAISGKAARMKVIIIPEEINYDKSIYDFCDAKFPSLSNVTPEFLQSFF